MCEIMFDLFATVKCVRFISPPDSSTRIFCFFPNLVHQFSTNRLFTKTKPSRIFDFHTFLLVFLKKYFLITFRFLFQLFHLLIRIIPILVNCKSMQNSSTRYAMVWLISNSIWLAVARTINDWMMRRCANWTVFIQNEHIQPTRMWLRYSNALKPVDVILSMWHTYAAVVVVSGANRLVRTYDVIRLINDRSPQWYGVLTDSRQAC